MRSAWRLALLALVAAPGARADAPDLFLGRTPVEQAAGVDLSAKRLRVTLELNLGAERKTNALATWFQDVQTTAGQLTFTSGQPEPTGEATAALRASSYLVDHADPAVQTVYAQARASEGGTPEVSTLVALANRHIARKNLSRGLDIASVVATRQEGDCTEHAVLLAALARASGRAARVVFGFLIAEAGGQTLAFGHAWTEVLEGGRWQLADATQPPLERVRYIPLSALSDEGYGCRLAVSASLSPVDVRAIHLAPAP